MKFFDMDGHEIGKEGFIAYYSRVYYLGEPGGMDERYKNSRFVEEKMERLLSDGIQTTSDVIHIIAWKIGGLDHRECERQKGFIYIDNWGNPEETFVGKTMYNLPIDMKDFAQYIVLNIKDLEYRSSFEPQSVLNILAENSPKNFGVVYLLTLLYFISKGKYPIYDRFAMTALNGIRADKKPSPELKPKDLPAKNDKKFATLMDSEMRDYMDALQKVFGAEYQTNRDIDRALWVYGHYKG